MSVFHQSYNLCFNIASIAISCWSQILSSLDTLYLLWFDLVSLKPSTHSRTTFFKHSHTTARTIRTGCSSTACPLYTQTHTDTRRVHLQIPDTRDADTCPDERIMSFTHPCIDPSIHPHIHTQAFIYKPHDKQVHCFYLGYDGQLVPKSSVYCRDCKKPLLMSCYFTDVWVIALNGGIILHHCHQS